jgi:MFS family permease
MPFGIRRNMRHLVLLALVTAFVGFMVGLERTVVPLMAGEEFGVDSVLVTLSFIVAFGAAKAVANFLAGWLADNGGRKALLVAGWLAALPVPFMIGLAPTWSWIVAANLLLGVNQGLCWTMTLVMMSDLAGGRRRGLTIGVNEMTGYVAIGLAALLSVPLAHAHGVRHLLLAAGLAIALAGLGASLFTKETLPHARAVGPPRLNRLAGAWRTVPRRVLLPRRNPELVACYQAGLVTKVNDAGIWGVVPLLLVARGFRAGEVAVVAAVYPLAWGLGQGLTGALSDLADRRPLVVVGMLTQALGFGLLVVAEGFPVALAASVVLGAGTALVYPTLLAAVRDIAHGGWEASAFGAYRLWRDTGFVVGALAVGALADAAGMTVAVGGAAVVSAASAAVALRLLPRHLAGRRAGRG